MTAYAPAQVDWVFNSLAYHRHNQRRQEHLASLGLDLHNRTVLEVGAGVGNHTTFFLDRGCRVISVEARPENCEVYVEAFKRAGYVNLARGPALITGRVEDLDAVLTERLDVVYCYGLLYHLPDPLTALHAMAKWCGDLLLLETCVSYGDGDDINPVKEEGMPTESVGGFGCRPTRPWLFRRLAELFEHVYVPATQPAHEDFPLDWTVRAGRVFTRAVFVASRRKLALPVLLDHVPDRQTRAP